MPFFRGWEMRVFALRMGFMKEERRTIEKWEWDFDLSNTGFELGFEKNKTICWEMGSGPPPRK